MNKLLDINELKSASMDLKLTQKTETASKRDVAIIGMSGKFPLADNITEFWENLSQGRDCIRKYPESRMNEVKAFIPNSFMPNSQPSFCEAGYLEKISDFDYDFFNISPSEARLMDPNQRLFLQTAWSVIEDAGYSGNRIRGTKTGVYLGFSSDMKFEYHMAVNMADPELYKNISLPGNLKSIIASRISYILDLKGPSIVIDTACSSGLVAVHQACRAINEGDCEMAIAGGVKVNILPIQKGLDDDIGIRSSGDRARTFDDSSDGTGSGEGVAAVLLKPLCKAVADGDHIYAVIKGSAVNQDGNSIGLTAPNSAAQEEVILEAWKYAGIDPETISYIEAHGTATKLGDPIEISGIERAFRKHTDKRNFCAVGSVKTNIGHLDNLAGIAGLIKLVQSLKYKEIPASIHFRRPNRKIDFINSPVYVNDRKVSWETDGYPRRAGISSFGLSGTNCHIVLEEYNEKTSRAGAETRNKQIFSVSAKNREVLTKLIKEYRSFLNRDLEAYLEDICGTANSGRLHFNHRLAIIAETREELQQKLKDFKFETDVEKQIYYGEFRIINRDRKSRSGNEISEPEIIESGRRANELIKAVKQHDKCDAAELTKICHFYVEGADIDWDLFYKGYGKKVSIPSYPFKHSKCWVEASGKKVVPQMLQKEISNNKLLDRCVIKTPGQEIYATTFSIDTHWVLSEHMVAGKCIMPGTAYFEMLRQIYSKHLEHSILEMEDILFLSPFVVEQGEDKELQIIISEKDNYSEFMIASKSQAGHGWNVHVEGRIRMCRRENAPVYELNKKMLERDIKEITEENERQGIAEIGPRWTDISKRMYSGLNGEYIACFDLPDQYTEELDKLYLYPPLMDRSINAVNTYLGDGSYLPLSYRSIAVYGSTPKQLWSYLKRKDAEKGSKETACFDILLMDKDGKVFAEIKDYVIKRVSPDEFKFKQLKENKDFYHEIGWKTEEPGKLESDLSNGDILVLKGRNELSQELVKLLKEEGCNVIEVETGNQFIEVSENKFLISGDEQSYGSLLKKIKHRKLSRIVHLLSLEYTGDIESIGKLEESQEFGVYSLFYLTRALISNKYNKDIDIVLIADYVSEIIKDEKIINPHHASLFGLGKVVSQEYPHLKCRCIDTDEETTAGQLLAEIKFAGASYQTAYRKGSRYAGEFRKLNVLKDHTFKTHIKDQGVYIITGGIGGIGLEIAKYIASRNKVKIALIHRTKMPERDVWDAVHEDGGNRNICRAIGTIREIEKNGSEVCCISADISDYTAMEKIVSDLRSRHGSINGIFHCAGVAGDGFIIRREKDNFDSVIAPKVKGTWILDKLTRNDEMDFFILFSSITALIGGPGQGDYTAANAYMDSFAGYRAKQGKRTLSINWPAWRDTGMAVDYGVDESKSTFRAIDSKTAILSLNDILGKHVHNVIIGELNYNVFSGMKDKLPINISDETQLLLNEYNPDKKTKPAVNPGKNKNDVLVTGGEDEVISATEIKIAGIWAEILGLEQVDIYDNFSELGGDSILATRLLRSYEKEFPGMVDIADVFAYATVNKMSEYIDRLLKRQNLEKTSEINGFKDDQDEPDELDKLLDKLASGEISISEAEKNY